MPRYGLFRYGRIIKYGRYKLSTTVGAALGPHIAYRIRVINDEGKTEYVVMVKERISLPPVGKIDKVRIRSNDGEWVYTQSDEIPGDAFRIRMRSITPERGMSEWVYSERAEINLI